MTIDTLLRHSAELLRIVAKSRQAADAIVNDYFRSKKYIGSKERQFISGLIFSTLRNLTLFQYLKDDSRELNDWKNALQLSDEYFICLASFNLSIEFGELKGFHNFETLLSKMGEEQFDHKLDHFANTFLNFKDHIINKFTKLETMISEIESLDFKLIELLSDRYSMPEWIIRNWMDNYSFTKDELIHLLDSLIRPADVFIRVNTLKGSRLDIIEILRGNGIQCSAAELSPTGIKIHQRTNLKELDIFKDGTIEVQDEGSQLIGYALSPEPGDKVLDACAGAGGKTLHIANMIGDNGKILATDLDFIRLRELGKRASRAGIRSVRTQLLKAGKPFEIKDFSNPPLFDSVLVDAPCSGIGTVRRMPMQKYRLNEKLLAKHAQKQFEILSLYSQYVKDGGVLVYSTCSLMPQENLETVKRFLEMHTEFNEDPLQPIFIRNGIKLGDFDAKSNFLTLFPHRHGTDGFFMARFIKSRV